MLRIFLVLVILVLTSNIYFVFAAKEFERQAQLFTDNHNFIVQAARDQNITLCMVGDAAALLVNDVNILPEIKKRFSPHFEVNTKNGKESENSSSSATVLQIKTMKSDLQRLSLRLSFVTNRTSNASNRRALRRFQIRVNRILQRMSTIEKHLVEDDCVQQQPCKNGGNCYDLYKDYYCECPEGWTGKSCEEDVDECYMWTGTDLGCQNNAICINTPGSYRCNCTSGFSGTHCRLRNAVCESTQPSELCGNGICVPANNPLGYSCLCNQGWSRDNTTTACTVDINECEESRNPCHDTCINLPGSFKCVPCPSGYSGNGRTCLDINECAQYNGGCSMLPRVQCINTEGSYHCGNCPPGWFGDGHHCEKAQSSSCDEEGICHPRAKCVYISEVVVCTCQPGWYGHGFGSNGCSPGSDSGNSCDKHECKNNATCVVSGRGTRCICPLGFAGPLCEINAACNPNPCRNGGTCNLLPDNKYRCMCPRGTTGTNCEIFRNTCGSVISQAAGELTYPPDGGNYESNERCTWIIRTNRTKVLNVTFSRFDLEESTQCSNDWLQIHDGSSLASQLIGRFCGKLLPLGGSFVSSHHQLFLWFRSDNATNGGGLKMSWISQEHTCGGELKLKLSDTGVIGSPGYPGKSPANRECEWLFSAPYGTRLIFQTYEVNLGGKDDNCTADTLKIFDSDQILESICVTKLPEPKHTSSNIARVHFHTDSYGTDSSFQLHYEVAAGDPNCGGIYNDASGTFGTNMGKGVCLYLIQQPIGTKIKLEFPQLGSISTSLAKSCILQRVEIFDGKTDEDQLLKKYCPGDTIESITSSGNSLLVRYEFMIAPTEPHIFQAKYSQACDESFFGPDGGVFTTPNYPNPYYDHITCTYNIYGPLDTIIHVNFTDFSISEAELYTLKDADTTDGAKKVKDVDDFSNYVDVYISRDVKRRYYKGEPMHLVSSKNRMRIVFHSNVNQRKARGFRVEYSFETINCGGVLTENEGSFSKHEQSDSLAPYCEWILEAPEGKMIALDMYYTRSGPKCATGDENLVIYLNTSTSGDRLVGSYCDGDLKMSTTFAHNLLTIRHNKVSNDQRVSDRVRYGLSVNYTFVNEQLECGGNFSYSFGIIKSPRWPEPYPQNADCTWLITAPLGHKIELVVVDFSLEIHTADQCSDDYLEIRDGHTAASPLLGKYCGLSIPIRIPSFSNQLLLHFHSDKLVAQTGFYLTWQQTATGCGGKLNSHIGSIHSPHYPELSSGPVVCDWTITVAQGSRVIVTVTPTIGNLDLCQDKTLSIYDGPNMMSRALALNCSYTRKFFLLRSSSNQVFVRYALAEGAQDGQQFLLDYKTDCVLEINDLQGVIESPNFPEPYPPLLNCSWDIRGGKNNQIALTFSHLRVDQTPKVCVYDYLVAIDMRDEEELKTHRWCTKPMDVFQTEGNRLILKFFTDNNNNDQGFHAEFKRIGCGEHLRTSNGRLKSPNAPFSIDINCDWFIEVAVGKQIILTFEELHMETEDRNCTQDVLTVSNDKNSGLYLLKECQISQKTVVTSMVNRLYIHFHTSAKRARKYFKATYTTKDSECGGTFNGRRGLITSPNYPDHYSSLSACTWTIMDDNRNGLVFIFENFDLPTSENCSDTFFKFKFDSNDNYNTTLLCGSEIPSKVVVFRNKMEIEFQAGTLPPKSGFALRYRSICEGSPSEPTGYIEARMGEYCFWFIEVGQSGFITLTISHLECTCDPNRNCTDFIELTYDRRGIYTEKICANHPAHIYSHGSTMLISAENVNFRARYSTVQNSCGGTLTSLEGQLVSPYYPNPYPSNVECIWEIKTTKSNSIELSFDMLNITSSEHCNEDFLEIRSSENGKLLGIYCSNELPVDTVRSFESVWIKFRSVEGSTGEGFNLRWSYAHSNSLNGTEGDIEPPPITAARQQVEPYLWRIIVPRGNLIWLNFKEYHKGLIIFDGFDEEALLVYVQFSPWQFTSSSNIVLLKSLNEEIDLFKIEWKAVSKEAVKANATITECQKVIILPSDANVSLASPGYPKDYASNLNCEWTIKLEDPTQHTVLKLIDVDIEEERNCDADSLIISSSSNLQEWHQELKLCKKEPISTPIVNRTYTIIHGTPNLKLNFHSDVSIGGRGFSSLLLTACGSNMTGPVGSIPFAHLLHARIFNSTCLWHIEVRAGRLIEFSFEFNPATLKPKEFCEQYAIIYDGIDEGAPVLRSGHICNQTNSKVNTLMSTSNHAVVSYNMSLHDDPLNYWHLTFREYSKCDGEVVLTHDLKSVNISSPRYPNVPLPHTECTIVVLAPPGESIQVEFLDRFDMNERYCSQEFVEFFDGATQLAHSLGRYCMKPETLRTTGNALYIHYLTAVDEPRNGYRINVSIALCGGTYLLDTGEISSMGYPAIGTYPPHTHCDYHIKLTAHRSTRTRVKITFQDIHLPFDAQNLNASDHLEILSLYSERLNYYQKVLHSHTSAVLFGNTTRMSILDLDSNDIIIRFKTFKANHNYRGFKLKYESYPSLCTTKVHGESGMLTIGRLSETPQYHICLWFITVSKGQRVRLEFLNLPQRLEVAETSTGTGKLKLAQITAYNDYFEKNLVYEIDLNNFTGTPSEVITKSSDNIMRVFIRFEYSWLPLLQHLRARFTSDENSPCPPNIDDQDSGSISLDQLTSSPEEKGKRFYCKIQFTMNVGETITFTISELRLVTRNYSPAVIYQNEQLYQIFESLNRNLTNAVITITTKHGSVTFIHDDDVKLHKFTATYKRHRCGGQFELSDGFVIEMPIISDPNYGSLDCKWVLKTQNANSGYQLLGNASLLGDCSEEYIKIYDVTTPDANPLLTICRNSEPFNATLLKNRVTTFVYHVREYKKLQSHFSFVVEKPLTCGSTEIIYSLSGKSIVVDSKKYRNNMECSWEFTTIRGYFLTVSFPGRFFLEKSVNCQKDYLEIQRFEGGLWLQDERLCGRLEPVAKNFTHNQLRFIFRTDATTTADGFKIHLMPSCNGSFNVTSSTQIIYTPSLQRMNFFKTQCSYKLYAEQGQRFNVRIIQLASPSNWQTSCDLFNITAYRRSETAYSLVEVAMFCGEAEFGSSNFLQLTLNSKTVGGVRIEFESNSCGGSVTTPRLLHSPKGEDGENYYENMNCLWNVTAPADHSIVLRFKYFEMERHSECRFDYVDIYSGPEALDGNHIKRLCGNMTGRLPPIMMVDSNQALIQAISDDSQSSKGFLIDVMFSKNCNELIVLTEANSQLSLVRHLAVQKSEMLFCHYSIMAPEDYRISLEIQDLNLGCTESDCDSCNHIAIIDSLENNRYAVGKYCSTGRTHISFKSTIENMLIKLSATQPGNFSFELHIQMVQSLCGRPEFLLEDEPLSLRFPLHNLTRYPPNAHCTWRIASKSEFQIEFEEFELQEASQVTGKCVDFVKIKTQSIWRDFCGNFSGYKMLIAKKSYYAANAEIVFQSDEQDEAKGFLLTIRHQKQCKHIYTATSGFISYTRPSSDDVVCWNDIRLPANYSLAIHEYSSNLYTNDNSCERFYIKIIDLNRNETIKVICLLSSTKYIIIDSNAIRVEHTTNLLQLHYVATKKPLPPGCGGDVYTPEGIIENPPYQDNTTSDCRWDIVVPPANRIRIAFQYFNMGSSINCDQNFINIIEYDNDNIEHSSKTYCERDKPTDLISLSNHVAVLAKKSPNFDGFGFLFRFSTYANSVELT